MAEATSAAQLGESMAGSPGSAPMRAGFAESILAALQRIDSDAMVALDLASRITYWSSQAARLYGYSPKEALGRPFTDFVLDERKASTQRMLDRIASGSTINSLDGEHRTRDGRTLDARLSASPITSPEGCSIGALIVARDTSDLNAILTEAAQVHQMVETLPFLLAYIDPECKLRFMNRTFETWFDLARETGIGLEVREALGHELYRDVQGLIDRALEGVPVTYETVQNHGDERKHLHVQLQPDVDALGKIRGVILVIADVSTSKHRESQLVASELRFRLISEGSPFGIIKADEHGTIEYANSQWCRLLGITLETSMNCDWFGSIDPLDRSDVQRVWTQGINHTAAFSTEFRLMGKSADRWAHLQMKPLFSDSGIDYLGVLTDISERKLTERRTAEHARALQIAHDNLAVQHSELESVNAALKIAKQEADAATQAKSQFLANMSHEIRTPMTAILGFTDVLVDSASSKDDVAEAIETIRRNGAHLLQVINDILDVSKIEAGKMEVDRKACSVVEIVNEVINLMKVRADKKNLTLDARFVGSIPAQVISDSLRLRQILLNLIGNALKFTETGHVRLTVELDLNHSVEPQIVFVVEDTGVGMTPDQVDRLFRPFMQADASTTRKFGGTGLGLTISKRLAQLLGGDIAVESSYGRGSRFTATIATGSLDGIALITVHSTTVAPKPKASTQLAGTQLSGLRILYAEDGPDNQRLINHVLSKAGATVKIVENGRLALEEAQAAEKAGTPYNLILMDMQMPVMDGYEATRRLRSKGYTGPIIALTAHAMSTDREKCLEVGCDDFASKPIQRTDLIATILTRATPVSPKSATAKASPGLDDSANPHSDDNSASNA